MKKTFAKDEVIFKEGDFGDSFLEVVSGCVGIFANYKNNDEMKLAEVEPGHIFGEIALFDAFPRSATAVALEDTELNEVKADEVVDYFKGDTKKIAFISRELAGELKRLSDKYLDICNAISALYPESGDSKPGILDKIKKFANDYKNASKQNKVSAESIRETAKADHNEGFSKKVESFGKGDILFKEGEVGKCMYDIHAGSVAIYTGYGTDKERLLTKLDLNNFFGEIGMLGDVARTATAVIDEDGTVVENIYPDDFDELFEKNPVKIEMMIKHLAFRVRKLTAQYLEACGIAYEIATSGEVSDELKEKARKYHRQY